MVNITRRQFLKGALLFMAGAVADRVPELMRVELPKGLLDEPFPPENPDEKKTATAREPEKKAAKPAYVPTEADDKRLLMSSIFPMLVANEKERLYFYRDTKKKITVGYGTNVSANPDALKEIEISYKGKKLSDEERKNFVATMKDKTDSELGKYTITRADAKKMMARQMSGFIDRLKKIMVNDTTKKSFFFDLPLCMQALCLDIIYNIGEGKIENGKATGILGYKKFKAALQKHEWLEATNQSKVYVNTETKTVNKSRENRKKRLMWVMAVVQDNRNKPLAEVLKAVEADYEKRVPLKDKYIYGKTDRICEASMARGELIHIRYCRMRSQELMARKQAAVTDSPASTATQRRTAQPPRRGGMEL